MSVYWNSTDNNIFIQHIGVSTWSSQSIRVQPSLEAINANRDNMAGAQRIEGANFFPLSPPLTARSPGEGLPFSIGLSVDVTFRADGEITFTAAGIHYSY